MTKKVEPLSTVLGQKRYLLRATSPLASRLATYALLLISLTAAGECRLHAEEAPLDAEFVEYLGSVETLDIKGAELLDLDELYQLLHKFVQDASSRKKEGNSKGKDSEHGDAQKK